MQPPPARRPRRAVTRDLASPRARVAYLLLIGATACAHSAPFPQPPLRWPPTVWPCDAPDPNNPTASHPLTLRACAAVAAGDLDAARAACDDLPSSTGDAPDYLRRYQCAAFVARAAASGLDLGTSRSLTPPGAAPPPPTAPAHDLQPSLVTHRQAALSDTTRALTAALRLPALPPPDRRLLALALLEAATASPDAASLTAALDALDAAYPPSVDAPPPSDARATSEGLLAAAHAALSIDALSLSTRALTLATRLTPHAPLPLASLAQLITISEDCGAMRGVAARALSSPALPEAIRLWPSPLWAVWMLDAHPTQTPDLSLWPATERAAVATIVTQLQTANATASAYNDNDERHAAWLVAAHAQRAAWPVEALAALLCVTQTR